MRTLNAHTHAHTHTLRVHSAAQNATTSLCSVYAGNVILSENFIGSAYKMRCYCIKRVPNLLGCLVLDLFRLRKLHYLYTHRIYSYIRYSVCIFIYLHGIDVMRCAHCSFCVWPPKHFDAVAALCVYTVVVVLFQMLLNRK